MSLSFVCPSLATKLPNHFIILRKHGSDTGLLFANVQNDMKTEMDVTDERYFARFGFKISLGGYPILHNPSVFLLCIRMYPIHKGNCQSYPLRNKHCEWWPGYHICEMYFVISEHIIWGRCNKKYAQGTHFKRKPGQTRCLNRFEWSMK